MSDEGKEFKLNLRLPKVLEDYVRGKSELYNQSLNEVVKSILIQHLEASKSAGQLAPIGEIVKLLQVQSGPVDGPVDGSKKAKKAKSTNIQSGPVDGPVDGPKETTPSRAPYISTNINLYKIYNNIIVCEDPDFQDAVDSYFQYRKEKKKAILPSQINFISRQFDKVISFEGVDGLIKRLHNAIANHWTGFVFPNEVLMRPKSETTDYNNDDF